MLFEQLLNLVPDPQKDDGANHSADDLSVPLRPERSIGTEQAKEPTTDETTEKADDNVPDETALLLNYEKAGEPSCDGSEEECQNNVHGFSTIWFLQI